MIPTVETRTAAHEEILDLPDINKLIDAGNKEQLYNAILAIMKTPKQKPEFDVTAAKKNTTFRVRPNITLILQIQSLYSSDTRPEI